MIAKRTNLSPINWLNEPITITVHPIFSLFVHSFIRSFVGSLARWLIGSLARWLVGSLARSIQLNAINLFWIMQKSDFCTKLPA
jgi:hypothetical protein